VAEADLAGPQQQQDAEHGEPLGERDGELLAGIVGLLIGLFVVRYREIFFGMLNLALSMVFYSSGTTTAPNATV
jgi:ABC-type branched-subunit amino acid transport system permease subunit